MERGVTFTSRSSPFGCRYLSLFFFFYLTGLSSFRSREGRGSWLGPLWVRLGRVALLKACICIHNTHWMS